jgi:NitT/TauT family transport system ATP-binding protein
MTAKLVLKDLGKTFRLRNVAINVLRDINLTIGEREFVSIVGPSGCGKTTLLRMAAGLESPSAGHVELDGKIAGAAGPQRAMVFQKFALFPHMTVTQNIEFGLKIKKISKGERLRTIERYLDLLKLGDFGRAYPRELSGGMQQRVAIARALVIEPEVLLMDEPFAALDAQIRISMQEMLLDLMAKTKVTTMFVTHSVEEAIYLADRVLVLSARPATVKKEIMIDRNSKWKGLTVPEADLDPDFLELKREVWSLIRHDLGAAEDSELSAA